MALQTFSHVGICVSDLDVSTRFYENVLGFRQLFSMDMGPEVERTMEVDGCRFTSRILARPDVRIELVGWIEPSATTDGTRRPMTLAGITHLCFRVDDVHDLEQLAVDNGGAFHDGTLSQVTVGPDSPPVVTVYLTDPDGTRIECIANQPDLAELAAPLFERANGSRR